MTARKMQAAPPRRVKQVALRAMEQLLERVLAEPSAAVRPAPEPVEPLPAPRSLGARALALGARRPALVAGAPRRR